MMKYIWWRNISTTVADENESRQSYSGRYSHLRHFRYRHSRRSRLLLYALPVGKKSIWEIIRQYASFHVIKTTILLQPLKS